MNANSLPAIDRDDLVDRMMGNTEMAQRMLGRFVESAKVQCDLMESTVRMGDKKTLASIAHKHKGTARTMAAQRIANLASDLEQQAHSDELSVLLAMVDQMRDLHAEVEQVLEAGIVADEGTQS